MRDYESLQLSEVALLSDRRVTRPYGLEDGKAGQPGFNQVKQNRIEKEVPGKYSFPIEAGDELSIETPSGGGYGTN